MAKKAQNKKEEKTEYTAELLLNWYEQALLMRKFEEKAGFIYQTQQKIRGFCHLYIGQEAVAVGVAAALRPDDYMISAYREHGQALAKGMSANSIMAELYGKITGCSKGKGGSMHLFSKEHRFMGGHGIVGGQIPLGAGIAFKIKYMKEDSVCVCFMGDGAVRQGALHEAFNMAMLWKLPVIFICENNLYAMGTSVERTSNVTDIYKLGLAYDMPSEQVNGMETRDVYEATKKYVELARQGHGPAFLEIRTYRYRGHSMSDPAKYRTKEELEKFKNQDPVIDLKREALEAGATEAQCEAIEQKVNQIVEESVKFADESPFPTPDELYKDVYAESDYPYIHY